MKKSLIALSVAACFSLPGVSSAAAFMGADDSARANCQQHNANLTAAKQVALQGYIPKPANEAFSTGTCLDAILNTRINIFTLGSLDGILSNIMNMAKNAACGAVMSKWNQVVNQANQATNVNIPVPYVGNVGTGVNIGTGYGQPITLNNQAINTQSVSSTASNVANGVVSQATSQYVQPVTQTAQSVANTAQRVSNVAQPNGVMNTLKNLFK